MPNQPLNTEKVYDKLRRGILENLRRQMDRRSTDCQLHQDSVRSVVSSSLAKLVVSERDQEQIDAIVCQIYHELYLERIIIPGDTNLSGGSREAIRWPSYRITDHGRRVLQTQEYSPYDPDGYLRRLKLEILGIDLR